MGSYLLSILVSLQYGFEILSKTIKNITDNLKDINNVEIMVIGIRDATIKPVLMPKNTSMTTKTTVTL